VLTVVCSEELPAQWQKLPLSTQQEMLAGRRALGDHKLAAWADLGEAWLRNEFKGKWLTFHTSWDMSKRTISLRVFRIVPRTNPAHMYDEQLLFEVTEPADEFITSATLTKIIMVS